MNASIGAGHSGGRVWDSRTVDVDIALLHELAQLGQPRCGVYWGHVDNASGS